MVTRPLLPRPPAAAAVNDDPTVSSNVPATTNEDTPVSINVLSTSGAFDVDGDALSVSACSTPAHGSATVLGSGNVEYVPDSNFNGQDSFTCTVVDSNGGSVTATVNVVVTGGCLA